jgi:hypothetical protein
VDQRFNQVNAREGVHEDLLIGLLCSTWFVATVETFGRTALGQGALEMPTGALRALPVPDIRRLTVAQGAQWRRATQQLLNGKRLPAIAAMKTRAQRSLDEIVLGSLGVPLSRIDELYDDTSRMTRVRELLAAGRGQIRREQFEADLDEVAESVAAQLKPLLQGRRFPVDFIPAGARTERLDLGTASLDVHSESMMGRRSLRIECGGVEVFSADLPQAVAEMILRALQLGQRTVSVPETDIEAAAALASLDRLVEELQGQLDELAARASTASQASLRARVEKELNFPVAQLIDPLPAVVDVHFDVLV